MSFLCSTVFFFFLFQDDLEIQREQDGIRLVGLVEGDEELEAIEQLKSSKDKCYIDAELQISGIITVPHKYVF